MEEQILRYYLKIFSFILFVFIYFTYILFIKDLNFKNNYLIINKNQNINKIIDQNIFDNNFINIFIYKNLLKILIYNKYNIHYGKFNVSDDFSFYRLIKLINKPSNFYEKITIVEGWSKYQLTNLLIKNFDNSFPLDYDELIADTYYFNKGSSFNKFKENLNLTIKKLKKKYENHELLNRFSFREIIIIASLIDKEGIDYDDKKKIYSVIINRLNKNMKLQIDASVIYSITEGKIIFDRNLSYEDLKIKHLYNTYYIYGLPPGPISYVGLKTIELIFENYKTNYLFYFYNNFENEHIFSLTYKEHLRKLNEFRSR